MRRFSFVCFTVAILCSCVLAGPVTKLTLDSERNDVTGNYGDTLRLSEGYTKGNHTVDFRLGTTRARSVGTIASATELRYKYHIPYALAGIKADVRATLGENWNTNHYSYWAMESIFSRAICHGFFVKASYRYRNAFDNNIAYESNTYKLGLGHDVKGHEVVLLPYIKRGDSDSKGLELEVTL